MKKILNSKTIPYIVIGGSVVGLLLRLWTLGTGADAFGLYPRNPLAWVLLWLLTAAVISAVVVAIRPLKKSGNYHENYPKSVPGMIGYVLAGGCFIMSGINQLGNLTGITDQVAAIAGLIAGAVMLVLGVLRLLGIDPNEAAEQVNEEEILMMVDAGSEKGAIDEQEKEFIQNVFEFDDLTAEEIAVHRTEVTFLWMEDPMEEWVKTIHDSRHTLYPVCDGSPDNIVGILNAKDYFRLEDRSREEVMREAVKAPFFVPETIKADVLFRKMKKTRNVMAIVLDEYGGMVGIITLNDLIEQLVGDLGEDTAEEEAAEPHVEQLDENTWAIVGNAELQDIEEALGVDIGLEEVETFTGLVFGELDMIPSDGPQDIELDFKGLHIHITKVEDHQIDYAIVTKLPVPDEDEEDDD